MNLGRRLTVFHVVFFRMPHIGKHELVYSQGAFGLRRRWRLCHERINGLTADDLRDDLTELDSGFFAAVGTEQVVFTSNPTTGLTALFVE